MPHMQESRRAAQPELALAKGDTGDESQLQRIRNLAARPAALAPILALLSCALFCLNGELLQSLQLHTPPQEKHASPLLNLLLCHLGGIVFAPYFLNTDSSWGPPTASTGLVSGCPSGTLGYLSARPRIAALLFALLLTGYNYAWLLSTRFVSVGVTNATFQVSVAIVYASSIPLFGEPLESSRLLGVALVLLGSMLAGGIIGGSAAGGSAPAASAASTGVALSLTAAAGVAVYQVSFRYLFGHLKHDARFLFFFSAWIGIWHIVVIAPLVWLASVSGYEALEFPSGIHAVVGTILSAAIASVVNILYLCVALWGTPMLLSCSSVLSVPLSVAMDAVMHGKAPQMIEFAGHFMVVLAVILILNLQTFFLSGSVFSGSAWHKGYASKHLEIAA